MIGGNSKTSILRWLIGSKMLLLKVIPSNNLHIMKISTHRHKEIRVKATMQPTLMGDHRLSYMKKTAVLLFKTITTHLSKVFC